MRYGARVMLYPSLDAQVRTGQAREHLLSADVVTDEHSCGSVAPVPERVERLALVATHNRQLQDGIAFGDLHPVPCTRP